MPFFVTPQVIALVILVALLSWVTKRLIRREGSRLINEASRQMVLRLKPSVVNSELSAFLHSFKIPLTLEVSVGQFGKDVNYYVIVSASNVSKIIHKLEAHVVEDYEMHHPGGVNIGGYLKSGRVISKIDFKKIDFSAVNEIGESAVAQFVFGKKWKKGEAVMNIRVLVSAPSKYQAGEILDKMKATLPGNFVETKSNFISLVRSRVFDAKEQVLVRV